MINAMNLILSSFYEVTVQPPLPFTKTKFWIESGFSAIMIHNETAERGRDEWAEIMKKESITS